MLVHIGFVCLFHQAVTEPLAPQVPTYSQLEVTSEGFAFPAEETHPQSQSGQKVDADPGGDMIRTKISNSLLEQVEKQLSIEDKGRDKGESSSSRDKSLGGVVVVADDQVRMTTFLALGLGQSYKPGQN